MYNQQLICILFLFFAPPFITGRLYENYTRRKRTSLSVKSRLLAAGKATTSEYLGTLNLADKHIKQISSFKDLFYVKIR